MVINYLTIYYQLQETVVTIPGLEEEVLEVPTEALKTIFSQTSLDQVASNVANVLLEITSSSLSVAADNINQAGDPFPIFENGHAPHENFHPCSVCSGRLMTV